MGTIDGSTVLLLVALGVIAAIVWAADAANRATLKRFEWTEIHGFWPGLGQRTLTLRHVSDFAPVPAALALHRSDLTPLAYRQACEDACAYCRTFVPHTSALCIATFDRYGAVTQPVLSYWASHAREVRALLIPPAVAEARA